MLMKFSAVLSLLIPSVIGATIKPPDHWPRCKQDSQYGECMKKSIQMALNDLMNGNETLGVIPLDPWKIKQFASRQTIGPIDLLAGSKNIVISGYKNVKVTEVRNDWNTMEIFYSIPKLLVSSRYFLNGTLFTMPVEGKGKLFFDFDNYVGNIKLVFEKHVKRGKDYFKVKDAHLFYNGGDCKVRLENLFNGNKELGDQMNALINQNWKLLTDLVRPLVSRAMGVPVKQIANGFFSKVPVNSIVPS